VKVPVLLACLATGCADFPHYGWQQDMPQFQMKRLEWNQITGPDARRRVANLCGLEKPRSACAIRIIEGGQCVVYSIYSEPEAAWKYGDDGMTVRQHEVEGHCGEKRGGGWTHAGASQ
jgi:hypothetical protein